MDRTMDQTVDSGPQRAVIQSSSSSRKATRKILATLVLAAGIGCVLIASATADILVTRDGARVETDGPWKEKGRLVVFTRPDGTLASLRLSEVDLEASRAATEEALRETEEASRETSEDEARTEEPAPRRPSRWSFTDADFTNRRPVSADSTAEEAPATTGEPADDTAPPEVTSWDREFDPVDQHVAVTGTVTNRTTALATAVTLQVALYDEGGELIENGDAQLDQASLRPGQEVGFRADFPDVYNYNAVRFQVRSTNLEISEGREARTGAEAEAEAREEQEQSEAGGDTGGGSGGEAGTGGSPTS